MTSSFPATSAAIGASSTRRRAPVSSPAIRRASWGPKYFNPAANAIGELHAAARKNGDEKSAHWASYADTSKATPYALRRGGISLRLRADPATTVAEEAGSILEMLNRHYAFAIHALRAHGPRPFDEEWRAVLTEVLRGIKGLRAIA
jgi:hypothetical protein